MKHLIEILIIFIIIILGTTEVKACGICVSAIMDKTIPPVFTWCLISISWFLLNSLIFSWHKVRIFGIPNIVIAIALVIVAIFFAGLFGPLPFLPFGITPAIIFLRSFPQTNRGKWTNSLYYSIQIVGFIATISILITAYQSYQIRQNRTSTQYMIQWQGSSASSVLFEKLEREEPASLNDYRYVLEHGKGFILIKTAQRIAVIGDPDTDSKRLKDTIKRLQLSKKFDDAEELEKSLHELQLQAREK